MKNQEKIKFAVQEIMNKGNLDLIENIFTSNYTAYADGKVYKGLDFIRKYSKQLHTALPDIQVKNIIFLSEENNKVTWLRVLEATHKKNLKGIPASNKKIRWEEMIVSHFEDDKISTEYLVSDLASKLLLSLPRK